MAGRLVYYLIQAVMVAYHCYFVVGRYFAAGLALAFCPLQIACFLGPRHALSLIEINAKGGWTL